MIQRRFSGFEPGGTMLSAIERAVGKLSRDPDSVRLPFTDEEYWVVTENMVDWYGYQSDSDEALEPGWVLIPGGGAAFREIPSDVLYLRLIKAVADARARHLGLGPGHRQRLLDMGCGVGTVVGFCDRMGLDAVGIEIQSSLSGAHRELGVRVTYGDFFQAAPPLLEETDIVYLYRPTNDLSQVDRLVEMIRRHTADDAVVVFAHLDDQADVAGYDKIVFKREYEGYSTCVLLRQ